MPDRSDMGTTVDLAPPELQLIDSLWIVFDILVLIQRNYLGVRTLSPF